MAPQKILDHQDEPETPESFVFVPVLNIVSVIY